MQLLSFRPPNDTAGWSISRESSTIDPSGRICALRNPIVQKSGMRYAFLPFLQRK
jgi:hypothetical protein